MKKILFILIIVQISLVKAQDEGPKVVVFNSSSPSSNERNTLVGDNLVKFSFTEAFAGDFSFYYERLLTKNISIEGGLGITLKNYFGSLFTNDINLFDDSTEPLLGNSLLIGLRIYPNFAPDDFYFAPEFKFKKYQNNKFFTNNFGVEDFMKESQNFSIGRISFGYQYFIDKKIFWDLSGGFGIAKITNNYVKSATNYNPITGSNDVTYTLEEKSNLVPRVHVSVKLGLLF